MSKEGDTRTMYRHSVYTKGIFSLEKDGEDIEVYGQEHILQEVVEEFDGDYWNDIETVEEIDNFYLTDYEDGHRFEYNDLTEMFNVEHADYDWNGYGSDWCGIEDTDTKEQAFQKWEEYKAKFPEIKSIDNFEIQ